ncbi:MAG: transposase [Hyphomicrobiaceae bacterium]
MRYRRLRIEGASYFFTVVTHERQRLFSGPTAVELLTGAIAKVRFRHPFEIEAQVVLPDHLHAIWTLPEGDANYAKRWRLIKEAFTRAYCLEFGKPLRTPTARIRGEQPIWQRRFWEHTIRDDRDFAVHADYIHYNPVRHGLVDTPSDWPHSSFGEWVERGVYDLAWGTIEAPALPDWVKQGE